jgi:hypothetical protein
VFTQQDTFKLRWFTPAAEVPLCGHATLASAATLFTGTAWLAVQCALQPSRRFIRSALLTWLLKSCCSCGIDTLLAACGNQASTLHFQTLSGTLSVTRKQDGHRELLQMSLPLSAAVDPLPDALQPAAPCTPAAAAAAAGKLDPADPSNDNGPMFSQLFSESPRLTELLYSCLSSLPAAPAAAAAAADKAAWLSTVVQHVGYVSALRYLLVALQPQLQLGRQGLEALQPDVGKMEAAGGADYLGGVIVSTLASPGGWGKVNWKVQCR